MLWRNVSICVRRESAYNLNDALAVKMSTDIMKRNCSVCLHWFLSLISYSLFRYFSCSNVPSPHIDCITKCVSLFSTIRIFRVFTLTTLFRYEIVAGRHNGHCSIGFTLKRHVSNAELSTILRPFYFAVHPDLFGQHPEQRVNSIKSTDLPQC